MRDYKLLIDGELCATASTIAVINPATEEEIAECLVKLEAVSSESVRDIADRWRDQATAELASLRTEYNAHGQSDHETSAQLSPKLSPTSYPEREAREATGVPTGHKRVVTKHIHQGSLNLLVKAVERVFDVRIPMLNLDVV